MSVTPREAPSPHGAGSPRATSGVAAVSLDRIRRRVADDPGVAEVTDGPGRLATIRSAVARAVREEGILLAPDAFAATVREVADALTGLGLPRRSSAIPRSPTC